MIGVSEDVKRELEDATLRFELTLTVIKPIETAEEQSDIVCGDRGYVQVRIP